MLLPVQSQLQFCSSGCSIIILSPIPCFSSSTTQFFFFSSLFYSIHVIPFPFDPTTTTAFCAFSYDFSSCIFFVSCAGFSLFRASFECFSIKRKHNCIFFLSFANRLSSFLDENKIVELTREPFESEIQSKNSNRRDQENIVYTP